MLGETDVTTQLLVMLLRARPDVVARVPVAGVHAAAVVVVVVVVSLRLRVRAVSGPLADSDVVGGEEEGAGFRAAEEALAFIRTVAVTATHGRTLEQQQEETGRDRKRRAQVLVSNTMRSFSFSLQTWKQLQVEVEKIHCNSHNALVSRKKT